MLIGLALLFIKNSLEYIFCQKNQTIYLKTI